MKKKSCINCAYFYTSPGGYSIWSVWHGHCAECFLKKWNKGFPHYDKRWRQLTYVNKDGICCPVNESRMKEVLGDDYGENKIPLVDGSWLDLSKYKCKDYLPKKKLKSLTRKKCWEEQQRARQEKTEWVRFWIPIVISLFSLFIAIISFLRTL